jgi:hypothetical protein
MDHFPFMEYHKAGGSNGFFFEKLAIAGAGRPFQKGKRGYKAPKVIAD